LLKTIIRNQLNKLEKNSLKKRILRFLQKLLEEICMKCRFFSRIPAQKPLLSDQQREQRLKWCIDRRDWTVRKWRSVIWSDKSRFTIFKNDGPGRVWRTPGTRFNIENMVPTVKFGGGGLMMWGCFSGKGLGPLVKVEGKMNRFDYIEILGNYLLPLIKDEFNCRGYLFQDDNAPVHTAADVQKWILMNKIKVLKDWPSQSPDLNPIEHLWSELERRIRSRPQTITKVAELETALQEEWGKISRSQVMALIESMPRRIEAVIANNGWPTKY